MIERIGFSHRKTGERYTAYRFGRSALPDSQADVGERLKAFAAVLRDSATADGIERADLQDTEAVVERMQRNLRAESIESSVLPTRRYYAVNSGEGKLVAAVSIGARLLDDYSSPRQAKLNSVRRRLGMVSAQVSNTAGEVRGLFEVGAVHPDDNRRLYLGMMGVYRAMLDEEFRHTVHHATEATPPENLERRLAEALELRPVSISGVRRGLEVREGMVGDIHNRALTLLDADFIRSEVR